MPPTQTVNVITSPLFYSSSLESGSQVHHHGAGDNDHDSWASALSSKALSRLSATEAGWINVSLDPVDETTWQEEAHWMSFHHAVQSVVVSCHNMERAPPINTGSSHRSSNSLQRSLRHSTESPNGTQRSSDVTGDSFSLVHSNTRHALAEATSAPVGMIHISVEEANAKTRLALAQAEQDEWEITHAAC
eukprot:scaffold1068_cov167-Amphora_coffeaeformis.AAC.12